MNADEAPKWPWIPLGLESTKQRTEFYDRMIAEESVEQLFGNSDEKVWESTEFKVGLICSDGKVTPARGLSHETARNLGLTPFSEGHVNINIQKYYVYRMPAKKFKLQLLICAKHLFERNKHADVGHCLIVDGQQGSHVNIDGASCLRDLYVENDLGIGIGVNLLADKSSEQLIETLDSEILRAGIQLTGIYNPVFPAALSYLTALCKLLLSSNNNKPIVSHQVTLSSTFSQTDIALVAGTYVILQDWETDSSKFNWKNYQWDCNSGQLLKNQAKVCANHMLVKIELSTQNASGRGQRSE